MQTYDCPPTLTDNQVLEFRKNGFLLLPGVVDALTTRCMVAFLDRHPQSEPVDILREPWFLDQVICNPSVAGAVRSLLGQNFALPNLMANHRIQTATGAQ